MDDGYLESGSLIPAQVSMCPTTKKVDEPGSHLWPSKGPPRCTHQRKKKMFPARTSGHRTTSNRLNPSLRASIPVEGSPPDREVLANREESSNRVVARMNLLYF